MDSHFPRIEGRNRCPRVNSGWKLNGPWQKDHVLNPSEGKRFFPIGLSIRHEKKSNEDEYGEETLIAFQDHPLLPPQRKSYA